MQPFTEPYFREALVYIVVLAIPCGLIGSWVVLRGLAFHSHAVGTATFPGLVLADGLGLGILPGAVAGTLGFTLFAALLGRSRRNRVDVITAIALAACLAGGVILASDVFGSGAGVDRLLFGSLLALDRSDPWLAAGVTVLAIAANALWGRHWLKRGFDPEGGRGSGTARSGAAEAALLLTVAAVVVAGLAAVGALLVSALLVLPAATVRLFATRLTTLQAGAIALTLLEATFGLWLAAVTDAPPGATVATVAGSVFLVALTGRYLTRKAGITRPLRTVVAPALLIAGAGVGIGLGSGCGSSPSPGPGLPVVATTPWVGELVREVGGDRIRPVVLIDRGADPHQYEPRPSDVRAIADSGIVIRNGGSLDDWSPGLATTAGGDVRIVDAGRSLPVRLDDDGEFDPHWWQDPVNVAAAARRIGRVLAATDPAGAAGYRNRAEALARRAGRLTGRLRACFGSIPPERLRIVTDHDAFTYFTERFGLTVTGSALPALSAAAAPSAGDLADLARTIREENIRAVFPEQAGSPGLAETIARDTGATVADPLYGDSPGTPGSGAETVLGAIRANADSVISGLGYNPNRCPGGRND